MGITDPAELKEAEEDIVAREGARIIEGNLSAAILDFSFLKKLHGRLFDATYLFAGQIRTVNITKRDSSIPFCYADFIGQEADRIFSSLAEKNYLKDLPRTEFIDALAELAMDLNALHPFREGRTIHFFTITIL